MSRDGFEEIGKKLKRETNAPTSQMGRRHILAPVGILNTVTPCAACKLLRRRCAEECPFSPYFSPLEPHKFAAVHKVFGASNVSKMLMEVPESQRADTANSLVYEANLRIRDPVYGCMGAISLLQQQIQTLQVELTAVRTEIIKCKMREATNELSAAMHQNPMLVPSNAQTLRASVVSQAAMHGLRPLPPPLRPSPPPIIVSSSPASVSSLYTTTASNNTGFSSISSGNVAFYD